MEATPATIQSEMRAVLQEMKRGTEALAGAQTKAARLRDAAERIEWRTLLDVSGTVADRNALAKLAAADARLEAELADIEVTRIKTKIRQLESEAIAIGVMAKQVRQEWANG